MENPSSDSEQIEAIGNCCCYLAVYESARYSVEVAVATQFCFASVKANRWYSLLTEIYNLMYQIFYHLDFHHSLHL